MRKSLLSFPGLVLLLSCNAITTGHKELQTNPELPPEMIINGEEAWGGDISLHISSIENMAPEVTRYTILSSYHNTPIGFRLICRQPKKKEAFISEGITFESMGDTSNYFLQALAGIYQVKRDNLLFVDSLTVAYAELANLEGEATGGTADTIAVQKKIFFTDGHEKAELFLNIYDNPRIISFSEKDSSCRQGIIRALSKRNH